MSQWIRTAEIRTAFTACRRRLRRARVIALDFDLPKRRGLLAQFHRHGHVEVEDIVTLFVDAGVTPT
jgi:hypothetical protein